MKATKVFTLESNNKAVEPFKIKQAFVALELGDTDDPILKYLKLFTSKIPTESASFLHVLPRFELIKTLYEDGSHGVVMHEKVVGEVLERMAEEIKDKILPKVNFPAKFEVKEGNPLEELLKETERMEADLIVIGQNAGQVHHGILAKNLTRKTACSALVIPSETKPSLKKILVPVDFSPSSINALRMAAAVRKQIGESVEIIALNIYELPSVNWYRIQKTEDQIKRIFEADRAEAFESFLNAYLPDDREGIQINFIPKELPGIGHYIMDFAKEREVDLIVMGAKGHSKVALLLMGSVTEKVLSLTESIPILVVK